MKVKQMANMDFKEEVEKAIDNMGLGKVELPDFSKLIAGELKKFKLDLMKQFDGNTKEFQQKLDVLKKDLMKVLNKELAKELKSLKAKLKEIDEPTLLLLLQKNKYAPEKPSGLTQPEVEKYLQSKELLPFRKALTKADVQRMINKAIDGLPKRLGKKDLDIAVKGALAAQKLEE